MRTQHTKGPWLSMQGMIVSGDCYGQFVAKTDIFDSVNDPKRRIGKSEERANALLIAAAPDLLAALKEFTLRFEALEQREAKGQTFYWREITASGAYTVAKEAIARAEGGSKP